MTSRMIHIDTYSGVNIVRRDTLPHEWLEYREPLTDDPMLCDANRHPVRFDGVVRMKLRLANRMYTIPFLVAENLAVEVLLGTTFLNKHINAIRCVEQVVELSNEESIPILQQNDPALGRSVC